MIVHTPHKTAYLIETELFCPGCGAKGVYKENSEGDYYEGPSHYCHTCKCEFTIPSCGINEKLTFTDD